MKTLHFISCTTQCAITCVLGIHIYRYRNPTKVKFLMEDKPKKGINVVAQRDENSLKLLRN